MPSAIIDASIILAIAQNETLNAEAYTHAHDGIMSSVNACEVLTKFIDTIGMTKEEAVDALNGFKLQIESFDQHHSEQAALLYPKTKQLGLSLGDRACLALGKIYQLPIITADRNWQESRKILGLDIRLGR